MVALHNRRLTYHELFRGNLWTDEQHNDKKSELRAKLIADGCEAPHLEFELSDAMMEYGKDLPRMRDMQEIFKRFWPAPKYYSPHFTKEEVEYLLDKLYGVNEPIGQDVLAKLKDLL